MDGWVTVGTKLDTKDFDSQIKEVQYELEQVEYELSKKKELKLDSRTVSEYEAKAEKLNNRLIDLKKRQEDLNKTGLQKAQQSMEKINETTGNVIKKVARWGLAIFGVRSAYMFIRQSASTLAQYNDKISADLEYMRFAIASSLEPLIRGLINLAYKLLTYVNFIAKAWFGVDLFANASADAMKRGANSAEKMKKSLAGFDEMNILNDNGSTGAMGGVPSLDLSEIDDTDLEDTWIGWIAKHKNEVISGLLGIAGGLTAIRLGVKGIKSLGIGIALSGIIYSITSLLQYIKEPTWKNFGGVMQGIGIAILGVGVAIGGLPAIVIGVIVTIYGTVLKYWDRIKGTLQGGIDWLKSKSDWVRNIFGDLAGDMYDSFVDGLQGILNWFDYTFNNIKTNFDEIISFVRNVFAGNWAGAWQNVKNIFTNIWNEIVYTIQTISRVVGNIAINIGRTVGDTIGDAIKFVINGVLRNVENVLNSPIRAINGLVGVVNKLGVKIPKISTINLPRLAVGGVVNMPGRGINYGGANIGERGAEGVIPLTNSQMMAQLGEAIGKYVNINATVPVYVGNRQIAREIKKINADNDFAFNR